MDERLETQGVARATGVQGFGPPPPVPAVGGLQVAAWVAEGESTALRIGDVHRSFPVASVGKILLLIEAARGLTNRDLDPSELLDRRAVDPVADSGLWQHLETDQLPLSDVCALVASVSDNLATNVLLHRIGLDRVATTARGLGLGTTSLHDQVRDTRAPPMPPTLATGSAEELGTLMRDLATGRVLSPDVSTKVRSWLSRNVDLSLCAAVLDLDPLAHAEADTGFAFFNKTGTDVGVRADVGSLTRSASSLHYAVVATWDEREGSGRSDVLAWLRDVGRWMTTGSPGDGHASCSSNSAR